MPSEQIRTHLISMYCVLNKATIAVVGNAPTKDERQLKAQIAALYHQNKVPSILIIYVVSNDQYVIFLIRREIITNFLVVKRSLKIARNILRN